MGWLLFCFGLVVYFFFLEFFGKKNNNKKETQFDEFLEVKETVFFLGPPWVKPVFPSYFTQNKNKNIYIHRFSFSK